MSPRSALTHCCGLALLALAAGPAAADESPCRGPRPAQVKVTVLAVLGSERDQKVEKCLECIARQVRTKYPALKSFRKGKMSRKSLPVGRKDTFALDDGQKATVTVLHGADAENKVMLKVAAPKFGEVTYETCCGKFFPIITRFRTKGGDLLIVAVCVEPCHGH